MPRVGERHLRRPTCATSRRCTGGTRRWFRQLHRRGGGLPRHDGARSLALDWKKFLLYVLVPHQYAAWGIITMNFLQHDGCDEDTEYNHSRNFVGKLVNWWTYNNGFHAIHHMRAGPALEPAPGRARASAWRRSSTRTSISRRSSPISSAPSSGRASALTLRRQAGGARRRRGRTRSGSRRPRRRRATCRSARSPWTPRRAFHPPALRVESGRPGIGALGRRCAWPRRRGRSIVEHANAHDRRMAFCLAPGRMRRAARAGRPQRTSPPFATTSARRGGNRADPRRRRWRSQEAPTSSSPTLRTSSSRASRWIAPGAATSPARAGAHRIACAGSCVAHYRLNLSATAAAAGDAIAVAHRTPSDVLAPASTCLLHPEPWTADLPDRESRSTAEPGSPSPRACTAIHPGIYSLRSRGARDRRLRGVRLVQGGARRRDRGEPRGRAAERRARRRRRHADALDRRYGALARRRLRPFPGPPGELFIVPAPGSSEVEFGRTCRPAPGRPR